MGTIRRGGFIFVTWIGDHPPRHVHVYKDGELILKWNLQDGVPMKGRATKRLLQLIAEPRGGGPAVKITDVVPNNRKRAFEVRADGGVYDFPYAKLRLRPSADDPVAAAYPDEEIGKEGFTYRLESGAQDTIHLDAVLEYNQDPSYLNEVLLHRLTVEALKALEGSGMTKRELIRRLGTSASQLYRLLDPTYSGKSVGQMVSLLRVLGQDVELVVRPRNDPPRRRTKRDVTV